MRLPASFRLLAADVGLLLLRLVLGAVGVAHGGQKLFALFGGQGAGAFADYLATLGVPAPQVSARLAGAAEFFGGILLAAGLFTRAAAIPFAFTMGVAIWTVHRHAFFAQNTGMEFPLTLGVAALALALTGPGRLSLDAAFLARPSHSP
jgi:putative oxidoreductase